MPKFKTAMAVRPYKTPGKWKDGGAKERVKSVDMDSIEASSTGLNSSIVVPKGKRIYFLDKDSNIHIVVLVGRFNKKVEVAVFKQEDATPEELILLESADEVNNDS